MYKHCTTEQSATRQRRFELGLLELMQERAYEDITISDLCEHLQIPRKTFYRYFSSKESAYHALLDHTLLDYENSQTSLAYGDRQTIDQELLHFFLFWQTQKPLLDALAKNQMSGSLVERIVNHITSGQFSSAPYFPNLLRHEQKHLSLFCVCGLMSMVITWHRDGYKPLAEDMAALTARFFKGPMLYRPDTV